MAKLSTEKRKQLPDSAFGIPEKRMYPLYKLDEKDNLVPDKAHIESAVKLFGHASDADKPKLARNILKAAHEADMDTSGWDKVNAWAKKESPKKKESKPVVEQHVGIREYTGKLSRYSSGMSLFDNIIAYADDVLENLETAYYEYAAMMFPELLTMEQTAFIQIGNDMLITDEDYESFYEEAFLNDIDDGVIIEFDLFTEAAQGPYDAYLKAHQYDPKTNTLIIDGKRVSAGKVGSKKQRNRMNAFLKRYNYDPETRTIETCLTNPDGTKQRVPFGINTDPNGGPMIAPMAYTLQDDSHGIAMDKGILQRRPAVSTGVLQHEIGHIASQLDQNPYRSRDRREAVREISQADPHIYGNTHGVSPDEYVADRYALRHNPYDKTGTTMTHSLRGYLPSQQAQRAAIQKEIETTEDALSAGEFDPEMSKTFEDAQRTAMNAARRPDTALRRAQATRDMYRDLLDEDNDPDTNRQLQYQIDQMDDMMRIGQKLSQKGPQRRAARKIANQHVDALRAKDYDKLAEFKRKGQLAETDLRDANARREAVAQRYLALEANVNAARQSARKLADMIDSGKLTPAQQRKAYRKYQRTLEYIERTTDLMHAQFQSPEVLRDPKRIQQSKQERSARKDLDKHLGKIRIAQPEVAADPIMQVAIAGIAKQLGMNPDELFAKAQAGELPKDVEAKIEELFDRYDNNGDTSIFGKELEPAMAAGKKVDNAQRKRRDAETARIDEARDKARSKNPDRKQSVNIIGAPKQSEKKQPIESASLTMSKASDKSRTGKRVVSEKEITPKKEETKKQEAPAKKDTKKPTPTNSDKK